MAGKLGIAFAESASIESCEDVRSLFSAYREGTLAENRSLLVKAHLRECGVCLRRFHSGSGAVDWSTPKAMPARAACAAMDDGLGDGSVAGFGCDGAVCVQDVLADSAGSAGGSAVD